MCKSGAFDANVGKKELPITREKEETMLNITQIMRSQHISRWTIVATSRNQSLAEHTFNVTMLVRDFCRRVKMLDGLMLKAALEHDLDEVMTGDIPTPVKRRMRENNLEPKLMEGATKNVDQLSEFQTHVLKMIDIMESIHFLHNFGIGHRATRIATDLISRFQEMNKQLDYEERRIWAYVLQQMLEELMLDDTEDA